MTAADGSSDLRINTVHAVDVAQALYLAAIWVMATPRAQALKDAGSELAFPFKPPSFSISAAKRNSISDVWKTVKTVVPQGESPVLPLFFVTDDGNSTQDSLAAAVAQVWGLQYGFLSSSVVTLVQQFAKVGSCWQC